MEQHKHSFLTKVIVIVFAAVLMSSFVFIRGKNDQVAWDVSEPTLASSPAPTDSPSVERIDTTAPSPPTLPAEQGVIRIQTADGKPTAEQMYFYGSKSGTVVPRSFLSSSKSAEVFPPPRPLPLVNDSFLRAMDERNKKWLDSIEYAQAMQKLVMDRYGYGSRGMITVDSLQRRVQHDRFLLSGTKAPSMSWLQRGDAEYLDSLLNALIKP